MKQAAMERGFLSGSGAGEIALEEEEGLQDEDLLAILLRDPFCGPMTPALYDTIPDRVLVESYFAPRTDDFELVPLRERRRAAEEGGTGLPSLAAKELPSREALQIPAEAWAVNPRLAMDPFGQAYCLMTWQVWRRRQQQGVLTEDGKPITDEYILERWRKKAGAGVQ